MSDSRDFDSRRLRLLCQLSRSEQAFRADEEQKREMRWALPTSRGQNTAPDDESSRMDMDSLKRTVSTWKQVESQLGTAVSNCSKEPQTEDVPPTSSMPSLLLASQSPATRRELEILARRVALEEENPFALKCKPSTIGTPQRQRRPPLLVPSMSTMSHDDSESSTATEEKDGNPLLNLGSLIMNTEKVEATISQSSDSSIARELSFQSVSSCGDCSTADPEGFTTAPSRRIWWPTHALLICVVLFGISVNMIRPNGGKQRLFFEVSVSPSGMNQSLSDHSPSWEWERNGRELNLTPSTKGINRLVHSPLKRRINILQSHDQCLAPSSLHQHPFLPPKVTPRPASRREGLRHTVPSNSTTQHLGLYATGNSPPGTPHIVPDDSDLLESHDGNHDKEQLHESVLHRPKGRIRNPLGKLLNAARSFLQRRKSAPKSQCSGRVPGWFRGTRGIID